MKKLLFFVIIHSLLSCCTHNALALVKKAKVDVKTKAVTESETEAKLEDINTLYGGKPLDTVSKYCDNIKKILDACEKSTKNAVSLITKLENTGQAFIIKDATTTSLNVHHILKKIINTIQFDVENYSNTFKDLSNDFMIIANAKTKVAALPKQSNIESRCEYINTVGTSIKFLYAATSVLSATLKLNTEEYFMQQSLQGIASDLNKTFTNAQEKFKTEMQYVIDTFSEVEDFSNDSEENVKFTGSTIRSAASSVKLMHEYLLICADLFKAIKDYSVGKSDVLKTVREYLVNMAPGSLDNVEDEPVVKLKKMTPKKQKESEETSQKNKTNSRKNSADESEEFANNPDDTDNRNSNRNSADESEEFANNPDDTDDRNSRRNSADEYEESADNQDYNDNRNSRRNSADEYEESSDNPDDTNNKKSKKNVVNDDTDDYAYHKKAVENAANEDEYSHEQNRPNQKSNKKNQKASNSAKNGQQKNQKASNSAKNGQQKNQKGQNSAKNGQQKQNAKKTQQKASKKR